MIKSSPLRTLSSTHSAAGLLTPNRRNFAVAAFVGLFAIVVAPLKKAKAATWRNGGQRVGKSEAVGRTKHRIFETVGFGKGQVIQGGDVERRDTWPEIPGPKLKPGQGVLNTEIMHYAPHAQRPTYNIKYSYVIGVAWTKYQDPDRSKLKNPRLISTTYIPLICFFLFASLLMGCQTTGGGNLEPDWPAACDTLGTLDQAAANFQRNYPPESDTYKLFNQIRTNANTARIAVCLVAENPDDSNPGPLLWAALDVVRDLINKNVDKESRRERYLLIVTVAETGLIIANIPRPASPPVPDR